MPDYLTPLEQAVIEAILRGVPSSEECFRFELQNTRLDVREFNGYGFFTNIVVPDEVPVCLPLNAQLPDAVVSKQLCGFILWMPMERSISWRGICSEETRGQKTNHSNRSN
jgi:hypothetical protein